MSQTSARPSPRIAIFCTLLFSFWISAAETRDDAAEHHVRELARRVSAGLPRTRMNCVNWNNHEAVSEARSLQLKNAFVEELQNHQGDANSQENDCTVSVLLERTPTQIVLTAEVENGADKQHFFAAIPRVEIPVEAGALSSPRLERELLWQQSERILDALFIRGENKAGDRLVILQKDVMIVYEKQDGAWKSLQSKPLGDAAVAQRSPRGELYFSVDQPERVKIVFAGKSCQTNLNDSSPLNCQQSAESARTGMLLGSNCDAHVWWLRGDGGDMTAPDSLELTNPSLPQTKSPIAELPTPGPVLSISSGEALRADTAVVFNISTGNYEVSRIVLACGL